MQNPRRSLCPAFGRRTCSRTRSPRASRDLDLLTPDSCNRCRSLPFVVYSAVLWPTIQRIQLRTARYRSDIGSCPQSLSLFCFIADCFTFSARKRSIDSCSPTLRGLFLALSTSTALQIDQKLLETDSKPAATPGKPAGDFGTITNLTQFDGSFEKDIQELRATPEVNSPEVPQLKEKPSVDTQSAQTAAAKAKAESAVAIEKELSEVRQQLLSDKPDMPTRPKIAAGNKRNPGKTDNQDVGRLDHPGKRRNSGGVQQPRSTTFRFRTARHWNRTDPDADRSSV